MPSTIVGLGTFGYLSTFNGSTNFISSGQGYISTLNLDSLTFASGNGWLDLTALRAVLVSTIQLDAGIGNFSSIAGNGSQIVALNAISSLSLESTIVGLGTFGYLSTNTVPSTIVGLGTFGYLSTNTVPSTIVGLGTFGYLSTNTVPSTIVGLGTFGYISTTQLQSTIVGWSGIPASTDVDMNTSYSINNVNTIRTENITSAGGVVTVSSDLIPSADDSYDLGSATNRWRELYVAGASIHLGNSLVLSEDIDGKLSTNAITVSSINVENLSTSVITTSSLKMYGTIDLLDKEIKNVLQTTLISSATTNLCLPKYTYITNATKNPYDSTQYKEILKDPSYFTHAIPFNKYRIQFSFTGDLVDTVESISYFYYVLSNSRTSLSYEGSVYNNLTPYTHLQAISYNQGKISFEYSDLFDITNPSLPNIGDRLYVQLYARQTNDEPLISFTAANCFVVTEPVV